MKSLPMHQEAFLKKRVQNYTLFHFFKTYTQIFAYNKTITQIELKPADILVPGELAYMATISLIMPSPNSFLNISRTSAR